MKFLDPLNLFLQYLSFSAPRAYIDPNTGGMLFQILAVFLALFSGIIFFFSRQIKTLFARLRRKLRGDDAPLEPDQTSQSNSQNDGE